MSDSRERGSANLESDPLALRIKELVKQEAGERFPGFIGDLVKDVQDALETIDAAGGRRDLEFTVQEVVARRRKEIEQSKLYSHYEHLLSSQEQRLAKELGRSRRGGRIGPNQLSFKDFFSTDGSGSSPAQRTQQLKTREMEFGTMVRINDQWAKVRLILSDGRLLLGIADRQSRQLLQNLDDNFEPSDIQYSENEWHNQVVAKKNNEE